jgi:hypothetical protein
MRTLGDDMTDEVSTDAAVLGACGTLRTLVDGSVRLQIDFEPKDRAAVMAQFGHPGTPIACVRLKDGVCAKPSTPAPAPTTWSTMGAICKEAIDLCSNPKFLEYIARPGLGPKYKQTPDAAKGFILAQCNVDSRKELDTTPGARELFIEHVRKPFWAWLDRQQETQR